ncbi:twin-arginine translocase TatA/TatE family subunit [Streptomyces sp. VRA16 Mangrove soil]|uniref:twin-arginine translocase TatA/TatE family subunit n=1 Tax=Streptomyces sp. VRA16 Mangrove soil TaxID=2817434 RepID=UPI001A9DE149|nr:twin-arginine translocase TatA/TatE family subunit [Streptomyces sp. VRA16 Mangrove soil]MBO1335694.1 twin-arginine translocase TatA/TatE family subunit [Streptomyces sp. VRA16 Mangrove soil]
MFGLSEIAVVLIVIAVVVGIKKLPELTRSAGKSARILKAEAKALKEDGTGTPPRVIPGETTTRDEHPKP